MKACYFVCCRGIVRDGGSRLSGDYEGAPYRSHPHTALIGDDEGGPDRSNHTRRPRGSLTVTLPPNFQLPLASHDPSPACMAGLYTAVSMFGGMAAQSPFSALVKSCGWRVAVALSAIPTAAVGVAFLLVLGPKPAHQTYPNPNPNVSGQHFVTRSNPNPNHRPKASPAD